MILVEPTTDEDGKARAGSLTTEGISTSLRVLGMPAWWHVMELANAAEVNARLVSEETP